MIFSSSASNITTNVNNNLQSISITSTALTNIQNQFTSATSTYLSKAQSYGLYSLEAIFAFILLGTMLSLLGILATFVFDIISCKKLVLTGWVIFGFFYFAIVVILVVFLGIGGVSYSFCGFF